MDQVVSPGLKMPIMWTAHHLLCKKQWNSKQDCSSSSLTRTCCWLQAGADLSGLWGCAGKCVRRAWKPHPLTHSKLSHLTMLPAGKSPRLVGGGVSGLPHSHNYLFIVYSLTHHWVQPACCTCRRAVGATRGSQVKVEETVKESRSEAKF